MQKSLIIICFLGLSILLFHACQKDTLQGTSNRTLQLPDTPYDYETRPERPSFYNNLEELDNEHEGNLLTNAGATLGRVLFYDKKLSLNGRVACATCHHQDKGFSDGEVTSRGFDINHTSRNAQSIANLRYKQFFFWDARESNLEEQVLQPIHNTVEMGIEEQQDLVDHIAQQTYYPSLFEAAFGTTDVNMERVSKALSQFLRSIESFNSKFDHVQKGIRHFTGLEVQGFELFNKHRCNSCHTLQDDGNNMWLFTANIGLEKEYTDGSNFSRTNGRFLIPLLRNIALTAPYMHDGRFETLKEVVNHYNNGIQAHPNLNWLLTNPSNGAPQNLNLSEQEKDALVAFLETLTDHSLTTDVRFSNPFR